MVKKSNFTFVCNEKCENGHQVRPSNDFFRKRDYIGCCTQKPSTVLLFLKSVNPIPMALLTGTLSVFDENNKFVASMLINDLSDYSKNKKDVMEFLDLFIKDEDRDTVKREIFEMEISTTGSDNMFKAFEQVSIQKGNFGDYEDWMSEKRDYLSAHAEIFDIFLDKTINVEGMC